MSSEIGIVVIGRNEGERLIACLESLRDSLVPVGRIVYVDSGSTDGSPEAASRMGFRVVRLTNECPFCAARARNEGFKALRQQAPEVLFVQFIDGDCILNEGWIALAQRFLEGRLDIAIVCGKRRERGPLSSLYKRLCDMEWDTSRGEIFACGGDFLVRAAAFEQVTGFNPTLIAGEEPELCMRLRARSWSIWRLPAEMTLHDAAISRFSQWWRRSVRSGFGYSQVAWMHRRCYPTHEMRPLFSAIFWAGLLPVTVCAGIALYPFLVLLILLYPVQTCRIAIGKGASEQKSWEFAIFMLIAKFAELNGLVGFAVHSLRRRVNVQFDYKR